MTAFIAAHAAPQASAGPNQCTASPADLRSLGKRIQERQAAVDKGLVAGVKVQPAAVEAGTDLVNLLKEKYESQKNGEGGQVCGQPACSLAMPACPF
jgi:hypothetical protein